MYRVVMGGVEGNSLKRNSCTVYIPHLCESHRVDKTSANLVCLHQYDLGM